MQTQFMLSLREARAVRSALTEVLCSTASDRGDAEVGSEREAVEGLIDRMDRRFGSAIQGSPTLR
jgi:hypothetical protein